MARIENDPLPAAPSGVAELNGEAAVDLTAAAEAEIPPELLAQTLGQYMRGWWVRVKSGDSGVLPVVVGIVGIAIVFQLLQSKFLEPLNLVNLFSQSTIYMVLAMAEIFALLLGEIDLSVGLVMGLAAVVVCELVKPFVPCSAAASSSATCPPSGPGLPWWVAIVVTLLICAGIGAIQGSIVARLRMPALVVTLAGSLILEGVTFIILGNSGLVALTERRFFNELAIYDIFNGRFAPVVGWIALVVLVGAAAAWLWLRDARRRRSGLVAPPAGLTLAKIALIAAAGVVVVVICNINRAHVGVIEGVPYIILIVLAVLGLWTLLLQRTRFGRYVYAIGGNAEAARRAGVRLPVIRTWGFVLASVTAGVAGILFASWQVEMTSNIIKTANTYVLLAVAAAVIGGTSLFGGRGKTIHGILGGLVIGMIYNGLYLLNVSSWWIDVTTAGVLLAAAIVDVVSRRGATSGSVVRF
jgi:D-xylose transport system permease protein